MKIRIDELVDGQCGYFYVDGICYNTIKQVTTSAQEHDGDANLSVDIDFVSAGGPDFTLNISTHNATSTLCFTKKKATLDG